MENAEVQPAVANDENKVQFASSGVNIGRLPLLLLVQHRKNRPPSPPPSSPLAVTISCTVVDDRPTDQPTDRQNDDRISD